MTLMPFPSSVIMSDLYSIYREHTDVVLAVSRSHSIRRFRQFTQGITATIVAFMTLPCCTKFVLSLRSHPTHANSLDGKSNGPDRRFTKYPNLKPQMHGMSRCNTRTRTDMVEIAFTGWIYRTSNKGQPITQDNPL